MFRSLIILSLILNFSLFGCGSDGTTKETIGINGTLTQLGNAATEAECPNGGVTLEHGIDKNEDGQLNPDEVLKTYVLCHGRDGTDGSDGSDADVTALQAELDALKAKVTDLESNLSTVARDIYTNYDETDFDWADTRTPVYLTSYTETDPVASAAGYLTSYTETDPVASAAGYLTSYTETDPVASAAGYLTSYTETDPVASAAGYLTSYTETDPVATAAGYLTSYTETDPVASAAGYATEDWVTAQGYALTGIQDNGDGTVTNHDYSGGSITWMKCAQGMTFENDTCTGSNSTFLYCDASDNSCNGGVSGNFLNGSGNSQVWDTCNALNSNPAGGYAGYDDWRVPNLEELSSLVQCDDGPLNYPSRTSCGSGNYTSPTIDTALFPNFPGTYFWTSAPFAGTSGYASGVTFEGGAVNGRGKSSTEPVFCVR